MALLSHYTERVGGESLEKWELVGCGGFGHVYKARHKDWVLDVAIKLLRDDALKEKALFEEVSTMIKASCDFVLRVYGIFEGQPPFGGLSMQKGIVMEFMGRGSLQELLQGLSGPPPWPLAFRLAHQVAYGMNFLHSKNLMHHDLKPNNVLLNDRLNAKLADFGLSKVSTSALTSNRETTGDVGGTYKYMPPEAFDASYQPVRAFDRYSYGILLWAIVTGKEPYPMAGISLVELCICEKNQRPPCENLDLMDVEGLKDLVALMKLCWDRDPKKRPAFKDCLDVTKRVFSKHEQGIDDVVRQVLRRLDSLTSSHHSDTSVSFSLSSQALDHVDHVPQTEKSSAQESVRVSTKTMSDADKANFVDDNMPKLVQSVFEVMAIVDELGKMVHKETYTAIDKKPTPEEKMRALYQRTFRAGGVTVKAAFYDILKRHYPILVKDLGGL